MTGWQPIETAPRDGTYILAFNSENVTIAWFTEHEPDGIDSMGSDAGWWTIDGYAMPSRSFGNPDYMREPQGQPTHWMPLPEPPSEEMCPEAEYD